MSNIPLSDPTTINSKINQILDKTTTINSPVEQIVEQNITQPLNLSVNNSRGDKLDKLLSKALNIDYSIPKNDYFGKYN